MLSTPFPTLATTGIGIVTPHDFALDRELWRWTPDNVTLHLTRLPFAPPQVTLEMVTGLGDLAEVSTATRQLITVAPSVVAYACTSGSFVGGLEGERAIHDAVVAAGAPAAVTTSGALVQALDVLRTQRVAIATPYTADLTARLASFLRAHGSSVVGVTGLEMQTEIWTLTYDQVADLVRRADTAEAEAIVISCTNVPTYDLIAQLETELGKPIVSANQVTMWAALRTIGQRAVGPGQHLLDTLLPAGALSQ